MDKVYLLEEIIEGLDDLKGVSDSLVIHSANQNERKMYHLLSKLEDELEHLISCVVSLRVDME